MALVRCPDCGLLAAVVETVDGVTLLVEMHDSPTGDVLVSGEVFGTILTAEESERLARAAEVSCMGYWPGLRRLHGCPADGEGTVIA